jgi:hypothetical protein
VRGLRQLNERGGQGVFEVMVVVVLIAAMAVATPAYLRLRRWCGRAGPRTAWRPRSADRRGACAGRTSRIRRSTRATTARSAILGGNEGFPPYAAPFLRTRHGFSRTWPPGRASRPPIVGKRCFPPRSPPSCARGTAQARLASRASKSPSGPRPRAQRRSVLQWAALAGRRAIHSSERHGAFELCTDQKEGAGGGTMGSPTINRAITSAEVVGVVRISAAASCGCPWTQSRITSGL